MVLERPPSDQNLCGLLCGHNFGPKSLDGKFLARAPIYVAIFLDVLEQMCSPASTVFVFIFRPPLKVAWNDGLML